MADAKALLEEAYYAHYKEKNEVRAISLLRQIVKGYPDSEEAASARELFIEIRNILKTQSSETKGPVRELSEKEAPTKVDELKNSGNIFVRLFRGDVSLPVTYWVWLVLIGGVGFALVNSYLEANYIKIVALDGGPFLINSFYWIWLAYFVFIWVAIWRSAGKHRGSAFWAGAARVIVVLGALGTIGQLIRTIEEEPYNESALLESERLLNNGLPTMIDDYTRLDSVSLTETQFQYFYTMIDSDVNDLNAALFEFQTKVSVINNVCSDKETLDDLKSGISYRFRYADSVGNHIADIEVNLDDCK